MQINIGRTDQIIRVTIGLAIFVIGFYSKSYWGFVGIIPLVTAFIRWCPTYVPFHITTLPKREA